MRLLSWNCQGLGPSLTENALEELKIHLDPSIVFLMETQNKHKKVDVVRKVMRFNNGRLVDPVGRAGGLALWWSDLVDVSIIEISKNVIDTFVTCLKSMKSCRVSFACLWSSRRCW